MNVIRPFVAVAALSLLLLCSTPAAGQAPDIPAARHPPPVRVIDPQGILETRDRWPVGVPLYVTTRARDLTHDTEERLLRLKFDLPGATGFERHLYPHSVMVSPGVDLTWQDWTYLAGTPRTAAEGVSFDWTVHQGHNFNAPVLQGTGLLPVRIEGAVGDILTGVPLPDLDEALATELNACFYRRGWNSNGKPRLWLGTYTNCEGNARTQYPGICHVLAKHPETTFAVRVQVLHDSVAVAESAAWWRGTQFRSVTPYEGMLAVEIKDPAFGALDLHDGNWRLHIKSDPETALRDFAATRYWMGDVTVPLRVTDSRD